jgi:[ribosomal protein S5]-alanine N-acetyltransferase
MKNNEHLHTFGLNWLEFTQRQTTDTEQLIQLANDPEIKKNVWDNFNYPYSQEDADKRINQFSLRSDTQHMRAIKIWETLIGWCWLDRKKDRTNHTTHFGYRLWKDFRGQWYGKTVIQALMDISFLHLKKDKMRSEVYEFNRASGWLLEKHGFSIEWSQKNQIIREWRYYDKVFYWLLHSDYLQRLHQQQWN